MTIKTKTHHCREPLESKRSKQPVESMDRRGVTTIKEHNITNSKRKRVNNNVTDVYRTPIKMRKKTAGLQKTEDEHETKDAHLLTDVKKKNTALVKELKKAENRVANLEKRVKMRKNTFSMMKNNYKVVSKKLDVTDKSWNKVMKQFNKRL